MKYVYLMCYVLTDRAGQIHFDRAEIVTDDEISTLAELEAFEERLLRHHRDKAVACRITAPPYMLRVEQELPQLSEPESIKL